MAEEDRRGGLKLEMYARRMSAFAGERMEELKTELRPTERELEVASAWRWKSLSYGAATWVLSFGVVRMPPWPLSTLASSFIATLSSMFVTLGVFARTAPSVLADIIDQPTRSKVVDDFLCPSLFEMQPCLDDHECAKALDRTSKEGLAHLASMIAKCRSRQGIFASSSDSFNDCPPDDDRWYTPPIDESNFPDQPASDH